jgi:hypothetical protein
MAHDSFAGEKIGSGNLRVGEERSDEVEIERVVWGGWVADGLYGVSGQTSKTRPRVSIPVLLRFDGIKALHEYNSNGIIRPTYQLGWFKCFLGSVLTVTEKAGGCLPRRHSPWAAISGQPSHDERDCRGEEDTSHCYSDEGARTEGRNWVGRRRGVRCTPFEDMSGG